MSKLIFLFTLLLAPLMATAQTSIEEVTASRIEVLNLTPLAPGQNQYTNYDFGTNWVGVRRAVDFVVTAYGPAPSVFRGLQVRGIGFDASTNCPRFLFPGQRCLVRAYFWAHQPGQYWGDMRVVFADSSLNVRLFGRAIYR